MRGRHLCLFTNDGILLIPSRPIKNEIHYSTGSSCFSFKEKKKEKKISKMSFLRRSNQSLIQSIRQLTITVSQKIPPPRGKPHFTAVNLTGHLECCTDESWECRPNCRSRWRTKYRPGKYPLLFFHFFIPWNLSTYFTYHMSQVILGSELIAPCECFIQGLPLLANIYWLPFNQRIYHESFIMTSFTIT